MNMIFKDLADFNQAKKCLEFLHAKTSKLKFEDAKTKEELCFWYRQPEALRNIPYSTLDESTVEFSNQLDGLFIGLKRDVSLENFGEYKKSASAFSKNPFGYVTVEEILNAIEYSEKSEDGLTSIAAFVRLCSLAKHFISSNKDLNHIPLGTIEYDHCASEVENFQKFVESMHLFYKTIYEQAFRCINTFGEDALVFDEFCSFVFPDAE